MTVKYKTLQRTPLYDIHKELGARLVPFAGFEMPVQYTGLIDEHQTVRTAVGIFDVSHMGIAIVRGPRAREFLNFALTRNILPVETGTAAYSLLCRADGGTIDDLITYCEDEDVFYLVLNASNKVKDLHHLIELNRDHGYQVEIESKFDSLSLLALQGPRAQELLDRLGAGFQLDTAFRFSSVGLGKLPIQVKLASTGYTGEPGCEIFVHNSLVKALWREIMEEGKELGLKAIGLGARDTLRTEMGYSLYGHELDGRHQPRRGGTSVGRGPQQGGFVAQSGPRCRAKAAPGASS